MSAALIRTGNGDAGGPVSAPTAVGGDGLRVLTLRPRRSLGFDFGAKVAALTAPLILVLVWLLDNPVARSIVAGVAIVLVVSLVWAALRYRRTEVAASRYGLVETGFLGGVQVVPAREIARIVRLHTYRRVSLDTTEQLFVVGRDGRCLLRLRGDYWDSESMDAIAAALDVPTQVREQPITLRELRRTDPDILYWWERPAFGH